ncbi:Hypothetical protein A7982_02927 [Minicystis rosea]|nr:Hypothetical protein A7982_02927 [Minicystis rosea]
MAATKTTKRGGGWKWIVLGALALGTALAVETGWAGFGVAQLRSSVFPRDESLLSWLPGDTTGLVLVDPHQLKLEALGADNTTVRTELQRKVEDIKKITGIDLAFDVDKLALSGSLAVARGRFDAKKLRERLSENRYLTAEHEGYTYLVRAGEDALAVIDDSVLLYGDEPSVKAGLTAHAKGTSLEKNDQATARLRRLGWDRAVLATVRMADDRPSVREVLQGSTGPRAVTVGVRTQAGLDIDTEVEAASPSAADELAKLLEEKRKTDASITLLLGPDAAKILSEVAQKATITADTTAGVVKIHAHLDQAQVDALAKQAKTNLPVGEMYKTLRLYQLLAPSR